jgi:CheY-like chemotaxis protein
MLSGKSESKERIKYKIGAQDYLTKPFNPEELDELVKKNLYPLHYAIGGNTYLNYNLLKEFIPCNQILLFYTSELS